MSTDHRRRGNGYAIARDLTPRLVPVVSLTPLGRATRKHPVAQVKKLAASLDQFGFVVPILIDAKQRVVAGWGLVAAARQVGLTEVPAISIKDLPEAELRALRLALNRITEDANWDREALTLEFGDIIKLAPKIELEVTGFELGEIYLSRNKVDADAEDVVQPVDTVTPPVSRPGDLWILGGHRVLCAEPVAADSYDRLLKGGAVEMMVTAPPVRDGDPELAKVRVAALLKTCLGHAASSSAIGATHLVCVSWRHMDAMLAAGTEVYGEVADLLIKKPPLTEIDGIHRVGELIFVYKIHDSAHASPFRPLRASAKGRTAGYSGTAVFARGVGTISKSVEVIAEAIDAYSKRQAVVLDPFGRTGATLMAAEHAGRRARVIEPNPNFVDSIIQRWQQLTGRTALNDKTGMPFTRADDGAAFPSPLSLH
jgi:hypothetical protein